MIKVFVYYSFGGYKIFQIKGKENEELSNDDISPALCGFPIEANTFFNYGGFKILYRKLSGGELVFVVKELPSAHIDGNGRFIPCSVMFVGEENDGAILNALAIRISSNINEFGTFFQNLFYDRGGLFAHGDRIYNYIQECTGQIKTSVKLPETLSKLSCGKEGVIFFVPTSRVFGQDMVSTDRTISELQLGALPYLKKHMLSIDEFDCLQRENIQVQMVDDGADCEVSQYEDSLKEKTYSDSSAEIERLSLMLKQEIEKSKALTTQINELQTRESQNSKKLSIYRKVCAGALLVLFISLIGWCSSSKKGSGDSEPHQTAIQSPNR